MATSKDPDCCSYCGPQCDITKNWQMTLTWCPHPLLSPPPISVKPTAEFDEAINWFYDNIIFDSTAGAAANIENYETLKQKGFVHFNYGDIFSNDFFLLFPCPQVLCDINPFDYWPNSAEVIYQHCTDRGCVDDLRECCNDPFHQCYISPDEPGFYDGCKLLTVDAIYFSRIFVAYFEDGHIEDSSCPDPGIGEYDVAYRISSTPHSLIYVGPLDGWSNPCGTCFIWSDFLLSINFNNEYPPMCGPLTYPTAVPTCDWREVYCE